MHGTYEGGYTEEAVALARRYCISAIQPEAIQAEIGEQDLETGPAILDWILETYMSGRTISEICRDEITALRHSRGQCLASLQSPASSAQRASALQQP